MKIKKVLTKLKGRSSQEEPRGEEDDTTVVEPDQNNGRVIRSLTELS